MLELLWPIECAGCGTHGLGRLCPTCRGHAMSPLVPCPEGVAGGWYLGPYEGPLGAAIRRAKFGPDRKVAIALGRALAAQAGRLPTVTAVIPAPSTRLTRLRRGFATASLVAAPLARGTGSPLVHALHVRGGRRQAASTRRGRLANLAGRMRATRSLAGEVLLVDDVVTTGATARACARELLSAGASRVWLVAICATGVQLS